MSNFAAAGKAYLESLPHLGIMEKRALRIFSDPDAPHNARVLARWEPASAEAAGFDPSSIIDWFKQNWLSILSVILMILPFFLAKPPQEMHAAMMASPTFDATSDWFFGKEMILAVIPAAIDNIGLAWARKLVDRSPLPITYDPAALKTLLLDTLKESQA